MDGTNKNQDKKSPKRKIKLVVRIVLLCIVVGYVYWIMNWKQKSDPVSERIIRETVAEQLDKNPSELTDEDFAAITKLNLSEKEVYDISLLAKFKNLEELDLGRPLYPKLVIPKWMVVLGKLHLIDVYKRYQKSYMKKCLIDLTPLENLTNLQILYIVGTPVKDINPLAKLDNLKRIVIDIQDEYKASEYTKNHLQSKMEFRITNNLGASIQNIERHIKNQVNQAMK